MGGREPDNSGSSVPGSADTVGSESLSSNAVEPQVSGEPRCLVDPARGATGGPCPESVPAHSTTFSFFPEDVTRRHVHLQAKNATRPLVIMKFGGTSVGDASRIRNVSQIIREFSEKYQVVVVVSAMAGVTDLLISAAGRAASGDLQSASNIIVELRTQHAAVAKELISLYPDLAEFDRKLEDCCCEATRVCEESFNIRQLTPQAHDVIASLGERLCAPMLSAVLRGSRVPSEDIDARECVVTDAHHGAANPDLQLTRAKSATRIRPLLHKAVTPVVTGFLGATADGRLTTLGRGGSDYSATILAAALDAEEVVIWTDVEGVLTCDPRLVPEACTIPRMSYRQAAALAYFGAKVLHPKTLHPVMRSGIPVWIRNTFAPHRSGTEITLAGPNEGGVAALAATDGLSAVRLAVSKREELAELTHRALTRMTAVRADALLTFETGAGRETLVVVRSTVAQQAANVLQDVFGAGKVAAGTFTVENDLAAVTVIGDGASDMSATATQAGAVLHREQIDVIATSNWKHDGNISFVTKSEKMAKVVRILHKELQLDRCVKN